VRRYLERPTVDAFLDAVAFAGQMIALDQVRAAWREPSALRLMSVGDVAGHLFLVLRRVGKHLERPPAITPTAQEDADAATWTWLRIVDEDDLNEPEHRQVRLDGAHVADWGWEAVNDAYDRRSSNVAGLLRQACPAEIQLSNLRISFPAYLATRIVEMLVHTDDLGCSVGLAPTAPVAPMAIAIDTLIDAARLTHGDLPVLRALARPDRAPNSISVF